VYAYSSISIEILLQVVDGTTIFLNDQPPKINEAPSLDNVTPEAIIPTATLSGVSQPTDTKDAPEIESSVSEDVVANVEAAPDATAALSDNPGASPTVNNDENVATHENLEVTDQAAFEEMKTVTPTPATQAFEHSPEAMEIQADAVEGVKPESLQSATISPPVGEELTKETIEENNPNSELESIKQYETVDASDELNEDDYIDDLDADQFAKLQETIEELKGGHDSGADEKQINQNQEEKADNKDIIENALPTESNVVVEEAGPTEESSEPSVVESYAVEDNEAVIDDSKIDSGLEHTQNTETKQEQIDLTESDPVIPTEDSENDVEGDQLKDHLHEHVDKQLDVQAEATEAVVEGDQLKDQLHDIQNQHEQNAQHNHEHTHEGHSHEHTHEGHSHEHTHEGHSHEHNHHDHGHHHGHSHGHHHDDHHGHSHSHGLDHLGHGVHQRVPEEVPDHYKPAEQKFDLPLSAQFAQSSQYQETTPSTFNYHESTQLTNDESNTVVTPNPLEGMDHVEAATPSVNEQEDNDDEHLSTPAFNTTPSTASEDATFTNPLEDEQKASEEADESGLFTTLSNMFASSTEHAVVEEVNQEPTVAEENVKEGVSTESIGNDDILGEDT